MKAPLTPELREACEARLNELREPEIQRLCDYAGHRLLRIGLSDSGSQDLVQNALLSVLRGIENDATFGRRPKPEDVESKEAFQKYLFDIILSLSDTRLTEMKSQRGHDPIQDAGIGEADGVVIAAQARGVDEDALWNDFKTEFFVRLRQRTPQRLQRTIEEWESVFLDSDRIPARFRKYSIELRPIAAEVIEELGGLRIGDELPIKTAVEEPSAPEGPVVL